MNFINFKRKAFAVLLSALLFTSCQFDGNAQDQNLNTDSNLITERPDPLPTERRHPSKKIKLALLLDTSGSMEGLIEQAKSQLWMMVNELAEAKCDNLRPALEIALYEYGNDGLSESKGFIRMVTALTEDLDKLSEDLFALTTNGGSEYCGEVIHTSLNELQWSESSEDLQLIFIAGNEPFTQGPISYKTACKQAAQNHVTINTIFCGSFQEGINTFWKDGAILTGGDYMSIDHNSRTVYIESPYDQKIAALNEQLNDTYVSYGSQGTFSKVKQLEQDKNARNYGLQNSVSRAITKSKHVYKNSKWDLVDAMEEDEESLEKLKESDFNEEMKGMSQEERKAYILKKSKERNKIKSQITELGNKRKKYVAQQQRTKAKDSSLDNAMISAIIKQAKAKNFTF